MFSDTINTGIYVLEPVIFDYMEAGKNYDFSNDLFPYMLRDGKPLYGFVGPTTGPTSATCSSTSRRTTMRCAARCASRSPARRSRRACGPEKMPNVHPEARLHGPLVLGKNVTIERGAVIDELCAIGDSTIVAADAKLIARSRGRTSTSASTRRSPAARSPTA